MINLIDFNCVSRAPTDAMLCGNNIGRGGDGDAITKPLQSFPRAQSSPPTKSTFFIRNSKRLAKQLDGKHTVQDPHSITLTL